MSSYNKTSRGKSKTTNRSGHAAYRLDERTSLVTMALTTMVNEKKFYGDNTDEMLRLAAKLCDDGDGEFVAKLAVWARTKGNLRSVSHALIAVVGFHCSGQPFVRPATRAIARMRVDDGTEILATYKAMFGDEVRWPHAIQRGVRDALEAAKPFHLAKYQSRNRDMKLRDVLRITHPNATSADATEAMGAVVDGTLGMPKGWETELSERGNTKEVWDELIRERRLGIFAQLRNLRNMIKAGADIDPVLENLENREIIERSRILPFRFFSALRELRRAGVCTTKVSRAIDAAMANACANVDGLKGRTAVLIDTSASMSTNLSERSVVTCCDVAAVLGAMVVHICADDACVIGFDTFAKPIHMNGVSIIDDVDKVPHAGGATNMAAGFEELIDSGFDADRVIILSDYECNVDASPFYSWQRVMIHRGRKAIQTYLDKYRKRVGHDVWCHAIDLQGYGTTQFIGDKTQVIAGWSDSVLRFIDIAESGFGTIVDEIEKVTL